MPLTINAISRMSGMAGHSDDPSFMPAVQVIDMRRIRPANGNKGDRWKAMNLFKVENIANSKIITDCEVLARGDRRIGRPKDVFNHGIVDENLAIAHALCRNDYKLSEPALLSQLESVLTKDPNVVLGIDNDGFTLLHIAAGLLSPEFCKMIAEVDSELVRSTTNEGRLPIHYSCLKNNTQNAKHLYHLYPESISTQDNYGYFALHFVLAVSDENDPILDLVGFLLKYDKGAVSSPTSEFGHLPLHMALEHHDLAVTKLVFDSYPEAIFINIGNSRFSPLDIAREKQNEDGRVCRNFSELRLVANCDTKNHSINIVYT
eukprot:scaffold21514_cov33-Cyclotella_meneghiniana.AAC.1